MTKPKPAPIIDTERLLALVPYISAHQGISLKELATTFGITTATLTHDLTTLWMCGLPGYTALELMDLSFDSGYVSIRNAPTLQSPRTLSLEEVIALLLGLDVLRESISETNELQHNISALAKRLTEKAGIAQQFRATSSVSSVVRAEIDRALKEQRYLHITYHSLYNDSVSERKVTPLEIQVQEGVEYLFAYCQKAQGFRVFRLDRITQAQILDTLTPLHTETTEGKSHGFESFVVINSRLRLMKERFALEDVQIKQEIAVKSFSRQWILRSVFAASGSVELKKPADLRAEIAQKAQLILDRYLAR